MQVKDLFTFNDDTSINFYYDIYNIDNRKYECKIEDYINVLDGFINSEMSYSLYPFFYLGYVTIENTNDYSISSIYQYIDDMLDKLNEISLDSTHDRKEEFFNLLKEVRNNIIQYKDNFNMFLVLKSDDDKAKYISFLMNNKFKGLTEDELTNVRVILEELVKKENEKALYVYAYQHYGDNTLYKSDFKIVKDTMELLTSISNNSMYQVTLGYIYFNGYGVKRDYKEAYYHFSIGLLSGNTEARYMISDMLKGGLGIPLNKENSYKLLTDLYDEFIIDANNDVFSNSFGDACIRLATFIDPINQTEEERIKSLSYLLKGEYAVSKREFENYYGDDFVRGDIIYFLYIFKKYIKKEEKKVIYNDPLDILGFINNSKSVVHIKGRLNKKKDRFHITMQLPKGEYSLFAIPGFYKCNLINKISFDIIGDIMIHRNDYVFSDEVDMDVRFSKMIDGGIKFQSFHNFLEIKGSSFVFNNKDKENNIDIKEYMFIRVNILNSPTYLTYRVNDNTIYKIGDIIKVSTPDGIKDAIVLDTFNMNNSDTIIDLSSTKELK